ncbi:MAG: peptidoglycan-associated lipoprotein Pal [Burkholderiaceae bacterium]
MTAMKQALIVLFLLGTLFGCSSTKLDADVPVESRSTAATGAGVGASTAAGPGTGGATSSATSGGTLQSAVTPVDLTKVAPVVAGNLPRIVYFDFDSYAVKEEYRGAIETYAKLLSADRNRRLAIEGHTDERGGREYNLALGQKRAEAVAKSLALLGAREAQLDAVSFGKERPAVQGNDESAWAKNRRAELTSH